ncbi:MAG: ADP-ribosylglycohydrolase family protein [Planctomycetes bacterium]|nr:ADP-ribosylglycohydrolase family protein [Planctomycetota bacterium]
MTSPDAKPLERAVLSLEGLSVGDAFGERFFGPARAIQARLESRDLPPPPWRYTDDTVMALGVVEVLARRGEIDPDDLARTFARRYAEATGRGYGRGVRDTLEALHAGGDWREVAPRAFGGSGSMGNGGAMRAAPVGAYFADDPAALVENARLSAAVTHSHPEGQAGAIAVAAAAAYAWCRRASPGRVAGSDLLGFALDLTPPGETRDGIAAARALPPDATVEVAAGRLGSGVKILAQDTAPFSLWCAARNLADYERALWEGVAGLGDVDTVCAIVGGIVVLHTGADAIPGAWRRAREPLGAIAGHAS